MNTIQEIFDHLPALSGTDKQVAWATELRRQAIENGEFGCAQYFVEVPGYEDELFTAEQQADAIRWLSTGPRATAKWWIDNQMGKWAQMEVAVGATTSRYTSREAAWN